MGYVGSVAFICPDTASEDPQVTHRARQRRHARGSPPPHRITRGDRNCRLSPVRAATYRH